MASEKFDFVEMIKAISPKTHLVGTCIDKGNLTAELEMDLSRWAANQPPVKFAGMSVDPKKVCAKPVTIKITHPRITVGSTGVSIEGVKAVVKLGFISYDFPITFLTWEDIETL